MKLHIHKFKRLENLTIDVPAEISGANGIGKTTILEAISFCLTGKDLDGSTFAEIYDNRQTHHEAIADVSYFDDYGNEYRRKVEPVFETNRQGEEKLKVLRNTTCTKNKIDVKDFASEFEDFYKFGTGFFFSQKETEQRSIFIDLMKSLLPNFDVKEAQEKLKSLKKTQRDTVAEIKSTRAMLKKMTDEDIPEIPKELQSKENEYQNILQSSSKNAELISKINAENNALISTFRAEKSKIEGNISAKIRQRKEYESDVAEAKKNIEVFNKCSFIDSLPEDTSALDNQHNDLNAKLEATPYYPDLNSFAAANALNNPIVKQNIAKLEALKSGSSDEPVSDVCPCCGVKSDAALNNSLNAKIDEIKKENRSLLEIDMREANNKHLSIKDEIERVVNSLNSINAKNESIKKENEANRRKFDIEKSNGILNAEKLIKDFTAKIDLLNAEIKDLQTELDGLKEPKLKELPTETTISEELEAFHQEFIKLSEKITGAKAVNKNNANIKAKSEAEIKEYQNLIANLDSEIVELQGKISDYFSNLDGVVKEEFKGKIEIGVQLQEYVITKDEYKDCFKIIADGKVFPSECNGAFKNNVKLQLLRGLQNLKGYKGITIFDNAEANTTDPINGEGLNLVIARATSDKELIIK